MSWSDYGVPNTMNARNWLDALTNATNERYMQSSGGGNRKPVKSPTRLSSYSTLNDWKKEITESIIGRGDYVNMHEFDPLDYSGNPWNWTVPQWKTREQLLEYLGEEEYDIGGHHFYPKYDRRFFEQQYRMLNELTVVFPIIMSEWDNFYGGTIRKRILSVEAVGPTVKDAFKNANKAPSSYENANWYGYSQPGNHVSGNGIYYKQEGNYHGYLQFSQIIVDVSWPMEAEIFVWLYPRIGDLFYGRNFTPFVRKARLINGHAEIETLTTEIMNSIIDELNDDEDEDNFNVYALGCFFDFKTENGFQFLKEEDNGGATH